MLDYKEAYSCVNTINKENVQKHLVLLATLLAYGIQLYMTPNFHTNIKQTLQGESFCPLTVSYAHLFAK